MAAPRTWVTAELVTASIMNGAVRDPLTDLAASKGLILGLGDVAGVPLTTGAKAYLYAPFGIRVSGWTLLADAVGSLVLDVWKAAYPTFPTVANTITGSEKPTLAAERNQQDLALSTWSTDVAAGSILGLNVDSTSGVIKAAWLTLTGKLLSLV